MSSKNKEIKQKLSKLKEIQEMLETTIKSNIEPLSDRFSSLCQEYLDRITSYKLELPYCDRIKSIMRNWFFSFLGYLDEVFILIDGVVHREYHKKIYKKFEHTREDTLTHRGLLISLSTDGIDEELNSIGVYKSVS